MSCDHLYPKIKPGQRMMRRCIRCGLMEGSVESAAVVPGPKEVKQAPKLPLAQRVGRDLPPELEKIYDLLKALHKRLMDEDAEAGNQRFFNTVLALVAEYSIENTRSGMEQELAVLLLQTFSEQALPNAVRRVMLERAQQKKIMLPDGTEKIIQSGTETKQ